jgi:hypothetical protein
MSRRSHATAGLTKFIHFNEEIIAARFTDGRWHIETANGHSS